MLISDLSYLENVSENDLILGGAVLGLEAFSSVDSGNTWTSTNTLLRSKGPVTKATGIGTAIAIGRERVTFAISINAQKKQNSSFELLLSKIGENSNDVLISGE